MFHIIKWSRLHKGRSKSITKKFCKMSACVKKIASDNRSSLIVITAILKRKID